MTKGPGYPEVTGAGKEIFNERRAVNRKQKSKTAETQGRRDEVGGRGKSAKDPANNGPDSRYSCLYLFSLPLPASAVS